jgi:SAM-dependent methyltransferase
LLDIQAGSIWNDLREQLGSASGVVLDIGCGAQPLRSLLPTGITYIGIDIAESEQRFGYRTIDTRYFEGDHWPVDDASVDLAFATETLEHVDDPARFLSEAFRVLRPGGRLILTVPFSARWHFVPYDYWRFTPAGLDLLLRGAGLTNVEVHARGNAVTVACYKDMALILPLLLPQSGAARARLARRAAGIAASPLLLAFAAVANVSLRRDGGDDCLGYTAFAVRPS